MYSYDDRKKAIALYIRYDRSSATTIRELGYPSRKALYGWCQEYEQLGDLRDGYAEKSKYSAKQKQTAVEYYFEHGRNISGTVRALGYPNRTLLAMWIDELRPGARKVPIKRRSTVSFSGEQKRGAVIALYSRNGCAEAVAASVGVSRQMLYLWKKELLEQGVPATMSRKKYLSPSDDRDELVREIESLHKKIHQLQLEHDILEKANELLKKGRGISPRNLTNREKTLLIDALSRAYGLTELLEPLQMPRSSYFYHRVCLRLPEKYTQLRQTIIKVFDANKKRY
ncbi:MAG TPA: IS3 family transposase, partial [Spirochaetia bacterium]|nr:IS3 family transposase [Spirochaetia bacterium]